MNNCIICNSEKVINFKKKSRDNLLLALNKCNNCGHIFQDPEKYVDMYSDGTFSEIARKGKSGPDQDKIKDLDKKALGRYDFYYDILKDTENILEVGSSIGSFLHLLKLNGRKIYGIEPDLAYADFSLHQYGFKQDALLLEEFNSSKNFDAVVSFHVIEHVQDPHAFVKKISQLLLPGGKVLLECPSLELHTYGKMQYTIWSPHIQYFTLASMYYLLSGTFKIQEIGLYGDALYAVAEKSDDKGINTREFLKYKKRSDNIFRLIKAAPDLTFKYKNTSLKKLVIQPFLQRNRNSELRKYATIFRNRIKDRWYITKEKKNGKIQLFHVTYYHSGGNAGDTVLSKCVRDSFNQKLSVQWKLQNISSPVKSKLIYKINRSKGLIIGGGGVLLPDTNKNKISGWQWAISKEKLSQINKPVIVFAIGYNYFHQQTPSHFFIENLKALIKKSTFFSLRNLGSIARVKELVGEELAGKIIYQPCPTTIIRKLYPGLPVKEKSKNIAVNIAFDRYDQRFGSQINEKLSQIAIGLKELTNNGYQLYNVNHIEWDRKFELVLNAHQIQYHSVNLQHALPNEVYDFYNNMELTIGMRGHAQMIPFGLNCKIISLGTHNKIRYFLEDIDAIDWYINVQKENKLDDKLIETFYSIMNNPQQAEELIQEKQAENFKITEENINSLKDLIM